MAPLHDAIAELLKTSLLVIGALFPIVDSPDNIPIFLTLTPGLSAADRDILARKIAVNSFALLAVSVLIGTHILAFFGISLPVVQVGGGLLVTSVGWKLLNQPDDSARGPDSPLKPPNAYYLSSRAFYPLTMPLTVGPGSISVAIAVGANRAPGSERHWILPIAALLGCLVIAVTVYLMYRFAEPIGRALGDNAMNVIVRLSSFILICIGVQITWNGASVLLRSIL
jgi:multiple antibiotic resistance protein